jgi:hypothetical protein
MKVVAMNNTPDPEKLGELASWPPSAGRRALRER